MRPTANRRRTPIPAKDVMTMTAQTAAPTRNTVQRALVMDAVRSLHGTHPTSADIYEIVHAEHPHVSRATVYRNLGVLAERGEILRVEVPNGADRYDLRATPHYHLKCQACGCVLDADMPYHADLADELTDTHGFRVTGHTILFTGLCAVCRAAAQEAAIRG